MKHPAGRRAALGVAASMALLLSGCDGNPLVSPASPIVQGIVEWADLPPDASGAGWGDGDVLRARIELPDTIVAGEAFTARLVTLRPSHCWFSDSVGSTTEGRRTELIMWVRGPRPGQVCPLSPSELARPVTLTFEGSGRHTIVLVGRRVVGAAPAHDPFTGEAIRVEVEVDVHGAPASEQVTPSRP